MPSLPSSLPLHIASALLTVTAAVTAQAPSSTPAQGYKETISGTVVSFEMVPVPGGTVTVAGQGVTVDPFLIGRTEVTWDMYDVFSLGLDAAKAGRQRMPSPVRRSPTVRPTTAGAMPATRRSAWRARRPSVCAWLSAKTGKTYRLPTEAEWMRAAALAASKTDERQREAVPGIAATPARRRIRWQPKAGRAWPLRPVRQRRRVGRRPADGSLDHARRIVPRHARDAGPGTRAVQDVVERAGSAASQEPLVALGRTVCRVPPGARREIVAESTRRGSKGQQLPGNIDVRSRVT